jgi:hypothetical protein
LGAAGVLPLDAPALSLFACPLREATGIPCLACGSTHAFWFAVRGRLDDAFLASPAGTLLAAACAIHALWTALRLLGVPWALVVEPTPRMRRALLLTLAASWAFVALRAAA